MRGWVDGVNCCELERKKKNTSPPIFIQQVYFFATAVEVEEDEEKVWKKSVLSPKQLKFRRINTQANKGVIRHIAIKEKANNRWLHNEVPFVFSEKYNEAQKMKISDSFKTLETSSCFRFVPKNNSHRDYLFIDMLDGCFSFVGKIGGRQLLSLAAGCLYDYIIWHEVMHALGLEHEHQRPDRDKFIQIQYHNVDPEKMGK
uniref:Metalloendopeptidase n=1 Tax=Ditylenchus dipsaci TaxID=166011 RepID=A0A915E1E2_9BILA